MRERLEIACERCYYASKNAEKRSTPGPEFAQVITGQAANSCAVRRRAGRNGTGLQAFGLTCL